MPPRPALKLRQSRPLSQVYIGKGATSPSLQDLSANSSAYSYASLIESTSPPLGLPDLPEPPSPGSSVGSGPSGSGVGVKSGSGLPSPPATNSTGSGSTGDPATVALRGGKGQEKERPLSHHSNTSSGASTDTYTYHAVGMPVNGNMKRSSVGPGGGSRSRSSSRSSSRLGNVQMQDDGGQDARPDFDDDYNDKENDDNDNDGDLDGDDTARLDRRLLTSGNDNMKTKSSSENVLALQRVKSLAQRNRLALDKLEKLRTPSPARPSTPNFQGSSSASSRYAASTTNPPRPSRANDHDYEPAMSGSETERESTHHSTSNSTYSSHSQSHSSHSSSYIRSASSSHHHSPSLSTSYLSTTPPPPATPHHNRRLRQVSAPDSPSKARLIAAAAAAASSSASSSSSNLTRSPSNRRRNRASLASQLQLTDFEEEDDLSINLNDDVPQKTATATGTARGHTRDRTLNERDLIIQSALAAAASSRRSPLGNRRRSALPKEFRSDLADESRGMSPSPSPNLERNERRESWKNNTEPITPFRATGGVGRSSTLRDVRRSAGGPSPSPNPRWSSDDFRTAATVRDRPYQYNTSLSNEDGNPKRERRQSLRGGSAESALVWSPGGRSLLGEGLRAAGLSRRKDEPSPRDGQASAQGQGQAQSRRVDWSPQDVLDDGRRRGFSEREREKQPMRAATSMAHYQYLDRDRDREESVGPRERERELRGHRSTYSLAAARETESPLPLSRRDPEARRERERDLMTLDRAGSSLSRYNNTTSSNSSMPPHLPPHTPSHLLDRASTSSPFGSRRLALGNTNLINNNNRSNNDKPLNASTSSLNQSQTQSEHTRLMLESLAMFETQLAKLPHLSSSSSSMSASGTGPGPVTGASQAELTRSAQGAVLAAERVAGLLKTGGVRAVERQVEAEVDDGRGEDGKDVWGRVAADYREGSRAADELVRGLTALLLGMGRVVRDFSAAAGGSEFGSPSVHGRHASLGDNLHDRRVVVSPDSGLDGNGDLGMGASGRRSVASRHSWEPAPRDRERARDMEVGRDREREGGREEALRRLAGVGVSRSESVLARASPSPATFQKLRDQERELYETPSQPARTLAARHSLGVGLGGGGGGGATGSGSGSGASGSGAGSTRKLFTPREQREQLLDARAAAASAADGVIRGGGNLSTLDSQQTIHAQRYEPSPTPASRTRHNPPERDRERTRTLTPLSIPKPLPALPSESRRPAQNSLATPLTANTLNTSSGSSRDRDRERDRRRTGTLRGTITERPSFPSLMPSGATTAVTPHTVSNTPQRTAFPSMQRTDSDKSARAQVTFSRPNAVSVSATLTDLHERHRTISTGGAGGEASGSVVPERTPSGSESERERDGRRKTLGARLARMSLDSQGEKAMVVEEEVGSRRDRDQDSMVHAADRSAASTILHGGNTNGGAPGRRERRRTVTDIWPRE
ncbi:hypothetical protein GALMADRAFT_221034 [Galerina marginata CBS 339.88]|uniref:Uncharacterized protein n=1 Tax=Galerina marginata (strain CBS 339.88) TaxID=685588 RepID=A0A067TVP2_GALM3|nr:hypothetical protein GALMADRAFT_221034 [Galerina marginata CBS 339.88]